MHKERLHGVIVRTSSVLWASTLILSILPGFTDEEINPNIYIPKAAFLRHALWGGPIRLLNNTAFIILRIFTGTDIIYKSISYKIS